MLYQSEEITRHTTTDDGVIEQKFYSCYVTVGNEHCHMGDFTIEERPHHGIDAIHLKAVDTDTEITVIYEQTKAAMDEKLLRMLHATPWISAGMIRKMMELINTRYSKYTAESESVAVKPDITAGLNDAVKRSITDIIPSSLSKILQELRMLREAREHSKDKHQDAFCIDELRQSGVYGHQHPATDACYTSSTLKCLTNENVRIIFIPDPNGKTTVVAYLKPDKTTDNGLSSFIGSEKCYNCSVNHMCPLSMTKTK